MHKSKPVSYVLKYTDIVVGRLEPQEEDFLNMRGKFELNEAGLNKELKEFIALSIKESDLIEEDHLRDISEEISQVNKLIEPYMYFIESNDWTLTDNEGKVLKILVPSFKSDDSIVWRWRI